jgi:hypothetical protein
MRRSHVIVLLLFLVAASICFFGWALYKFCRRSIDAKYHETSYQRDVEAQAAAAALKSSSKKSGSKSGSKKSGSKSGSKKSGSKK